jgi:hypothetical protein
MARTSIRRHQHEQPNDHRELALSMRADVTGVGASLDQRLVHAAPIGSGDRRNAGAARMPVSARRLMAKLLPLRRCAASRLRELAERLEPRRQTLAGRSSAPLVRLDGRWWYRDEIVDGATSVERRS